MGYDIKIQDVLALTDWAASLASSASEQLEAISSAAQGIQALDDFRGQSASNAREYWGDAVAPAAQSVEVALQELSERCALYAQPYTSGEIDSDINAHLEQDSIKNASSRLGDIRQSLTEHASSFNSTLAPALPILGCDAPDEGQADGALGDTISVADQLDARVTEHETWHAGDCSDSFSATLTSLSSALSRLASYGGGGGYVSGDFPDRSQDLIQAEQDSLAYVQAHGEDAGAAIADMQKRQNEYTIKYVPVDTSDPARTIFDGFLNGTDKFATVNQGVFSLFGRIASALNETDAKQALKQVEGVFENIGEVTGVLSLAEGLSDAATARDNYYNTHPDMPEDQRESNALAEYDIHVVTSLIDAYVPFFSDDVKDAYYSWVYDDSDGDGNSVASNVYDWRYDLYQMGL
jgi:hypothetical protein